MAMSSRQQNMVTSTSTENCSTAILSPRSTNIDSQGGTAWVTALVIGLLVLTVFIGVCYLDWRRQNARRNDEEQIGTERGALEGQTGASATENEQWRQEDYDPSSIPPELLEIYKRDWRDTKAKQGVDPILLSKLETKLDGTSSVHPYDSLSTYPEATSALEALIALQDKDMMKRWMEERGNYTQVNLGDDQGRTAVVQHPVGTTAAPYQWPQPSSRGQGNDDSQDIELTQLPSPSPVYAVPGRSNDTPPPIPVKSASRSTARSSVMTPQPEEGESSRQQATSRPRTAVSGFSIETRFLQPRSEVGTESRYPHSMAAETDISDDPFVTEARLNYQKRFEAEKKEPEVLEHKRRE
jgi:hypothetical protein